MIYHRYVQVMTFVAISSIAMARKNVVDTLRRLRALRKNTARQIDPRELLAAWDHCVLADMFGNSVSLIKQHVLNMVQLLESLGFISRCS